MATDTIPTHITDYFSLLGVTPESGAEEIRAAFMAKALVYHPDKAPTEKRAEFEKIYEHLKNAYKILSNDRSKKQYADSQQKTFLDLKGDTRNTGYTHSDKYQKFDENGVARLDEAAFADAFDSTRKEEELRVLKALREKHSNDTKVTHTDYETLMQRRQEEMSQLHSQQQRFIAGTGQEFDRNTFNRAFDVMRSTTNDVEPYTGPKAMFSTGTLQETDTFSSLNMLNGFEFGQGSTVNQFIPGAEVNYGLLNMDELRAGGTYGEEKPLTAAELEARMNSHLGDRKRLAGMKADEFDTTASEIETLYADLFAPSDVEGLPAPIGVVGQATAS